MSVNIKSVRMALRRALFDAGVSAERFVSENRGVAISPGPDPWVEEVVSPSSERHVATRLLRGRGVTAFRVKVPINSGTETAEALAKTIKDALQPTSSFTHDGTVVFVERTEQGAGFSDRTDDDSVDGAWFVVPVYVTWRAHAFL